MPTILNNRTTALITTDIPVVGDQTIQVTITGVNVTSGDYTIGTQTVTILDGESSASTDIIIVDDSLIEGTESAVVSLSNPSSGLSLGTIVSKDLEILDNDVVIPLSVSISASAQNLYESIPNDEVIIYVTSSETLSSDHYITLTLTGTATNSDDYLIDTLSVLIAGNSNVGATTLSVVDNTILESIETVIVTITAVPSGLTIGTPSSVTVSIIDDEVQVDPPGWNDYIYPSHIQLKTMRISATGDVLWFHAYTVGDFGNGPQNDNFFVRSTNKGATLVVTTVPVPANGGNWSINGDGKKFTWPTGVANTLYQFESGTFNLLSTTQIPAITNAVPGSIANNYNVPIITEWAWLTDNDELITLKQTALYQPGQSNVATYTVSETTNFGASYGDNGVGFSPPLNSTWFIKAPLRNTYAVTSDGNKFYMLDSVSVFNVSKTMYLHKTLNRGATWTRVSLGVLPGLNTPLTPQLTYDGLLAAVTTNIVLMKTSRFTKAGPSAPIVRLSNPLRISTDAGETFTDVSGLPAYLWGSWDMSDSGSIMAIITETTVSSAKVFSLYVSRDSGITWIQEKTWTPVLITRITNYTVNVTNNGSTVFVLDAALNTLHVLTI